MSGSRRQATGTRVDPSRPIRFRFDDRDLDGLTGDTLASALLAAGVDVVSSSPVRGRPRGIMSAGVEEPGAFVEIEAPYRDVFVPAPAVELVEGLVALGRSDRGRLPRSEGAGDTERVQTRSLHCDVLVIGAGPAGLAAALAAGRADSRVLLVDEGPELGGTLAAGDPPIDGLPPLAWVVRTAVELSSLPEVRVMTRTTALGLHDAGFVVAHERVSRHLATPPSGMPAERIWHVRARQVVVAAGAHERPVIFAGNDRPGVMLASAARAYMERFGVLAGERAVLFTTNDGAYRAALDLLEAGGEVAAVVDPREDAPVQRFARDRGVEVLAGWVLSAARGEMRVQSVELRGPDGATRETDADLVLVSGGWNPAAHLHRHLGGALRYDERLACFAPVDVPNGRRVAGAANGTFDLAACLAEGAAAGAAAAAGAGFDAGPPAVPEAAPGDESDPVAVWFVPPGPGSGPTDCFVDLQRDSTVADVAEALGAGFREIEHVKRYTYIGTTYDQGRTSGVLAAALVAELIGSPVGSIGPSNARPPFVPVAFSTIAGRDRGRLYDPERRTPLHRWHVVHAARFENVGQWKRPWFFPQRGESMEAAVRRECLAVRETVGAMDASTLGKIEVVGTDAAAFLDRMYTNAMSRLPVGRARYGLMLGLDGMVFDDGVAMRVADDRFVVTTTTGGAARVLDRFEEWLQTEWTDLRVYCTSVTEQWATIAVAGPRSRDVLAGLGTDVALDADAFPFMAFRDGTVAGMSARIARISFSGELAFEINVDGRLGLAMWEAVMEAGGPLGIAPYGTEAMHVLRAEKGFVIVGQDTDGTVTPDDLGMGWIVNESKGDFIGKRSLRRPDTARADRKQLVGLLAVEPGALIPEGAQIVLEETGRIPMPMAGHVTSSYESPILGRTIALALIERGRDLHGKTVYAPIEDRSIAATVNEPVFYDPEGSRRDG